MNNNIQMKKYIFYVIFANLALVSCKNNEWSFDDFEYSAVYFAYQSPVRTITLGEDIYDNSMDNQHKCQIMATMSGVYSNPKDVTIDFEVNNDLVNGLIYDGTQQPVLAMPTHYYTLASDKIVIPKGNIVGGVEVQLTDAFFEDPKAISTNYVIPLQMKQVHNADSILKGRPVPSILNPHPAVGYEWDVVPKDYIFYAIKYINTWHSTYLRRGKDVITGDNGNSSLNQTISRRNKYIEKDEVCHIETVSLDKAIFSSSIKDSDNNDMHYQLILTFDDNDKCTISGQSTDYTASGTGQFVKRGDKNSWGGEDRDVLYLDYEIKFADRTLNTMDTLAVRDRGVVMETFTPVRQ